MNRLQLIKLLRLLAKSQKIENPNQPKTRANFLRLINSKKH